MMTTIAAILLLVGLVTQILAWTGSLDSIEKGSPGFYRLALSGPARMALVLAAIALFARVWIDKRAPQTPLAGVAAPLTENEQPPAPPAEATAPSGSAADGGAAAKPSDNDFGPAEPNIKWQQRAVPLKDGKAGVTVTFSLDRMLDVPAFWAGCNQPCTTESATMEGTHRVQGLSVGNPRVAVLLLATPRPLPPGIQVKWVIRAKDTAPLQIVTVQRIDPSQVPEIR